MAIISSSKRQSICLCCAVVVLLCSTLAPRAAQAQGSNNDTGSVKSFINSVAKTIYSAAWPTATYKSVSIESIQPVDSGFDVLIKLSGTSAFDGSDLWLVLALELRNGALHDITVRDDNHFLVAPFATTKAMANLLVEVGKRYVESQSPAPAPSSNALPMAGAVCLVNATDIDLVFSYRWEGSAWQDDKVEADKSEWFWWPYPGPDHSSPQFDIRYDDSLAPGYTEQNYALERNAVPLPANCDGAKQYRFTLDGDSIVLNAIN